MKNSISLLLCVSLLTCLSLNLYSQSAENEFDQVKLTKQFLGTWKSEIGKDSIVLAEIVTSGNGIYSHLEWKAKGITYATAISVIGISDQNESVVIYSLWNGGDLSEDIGKFVSPKKLMMERYLPGQPNHAVALSEIEFPTPDIYTWKLMWRGMETTWEPAWTVNWKFTKVKE